MSLWQAAPEPTSPLARRRVLSARAGVHVSPLCLGAMSIGDKWSEAMGSMDRESSFKLLDAFYEAGGNFIDTANNYQDETSEKFIGEWMEQRGIRDQIVIATKYTSNYKARSGVKDETPYIGNGARSLHLSVNASLKKLRTDFIDILYVHWWDYVTSIEEVMDSLHNLVQQGKVLYLGISDTPAWIVASANRYARDHGKTPFSIYQGFWSILNRDLERDIVPMCVAEGMAIAPWGALGEGKLRTDAEEEERAKSGENGRALFGDWRRNETELKVSRALEKIAKEVGAKNIISIAIAWIMQKVPYVFPILGGRKVEHLHGNIESLTINLTKQQVEELDSLLPFDLGFPYNRFGHGEYNFLYRSTGAFDKWPVAEPIRPKTQTQ